MLNLIVVNAVSRRYIPQDSGNVLRGQHHRDTRGTSGGSRIYRIYQSVGVDAPQHRHVKHLRQVDVVDKGSLSGD